MKKTNSIGLKILMFVFVFVMFVSVAPKLNTADAYLRDIVPSGVYGGWGTSYTMGYRFTPQSNGQITHLWCYSAGTSTVTLWSDAGSQLASTSINCNAGWVSGAITPVSVTSGTYYRVTVWGSNYYGTISVPNSTTGITIDSGYYSSGSNVFPTNNSGQTMYGMADVTLSAGGGGSCTLFPGSQIATSGNETTVAGWLGGTPKQGTLIYRRSTNGSASSTFHSLVDGQGETISLIKTTNNRVIGGYNPNSWSSSSAYDTGSAGFLFNLTYGFRLTNTNSSYMTYNYNSYGPCFGGGHDMCVNSSTTASGYNGTHSYQNPSTYGYSYLEGAYSWNVSDIEVYKLSTTCSGGGPIVTTTGSGGYSYNYFYASGTVNPGAESDVLGAYRYGTSNVACTSLPNSGTAGSWLTTNTVNTINVYISANPSTTYYYCIGAYDNSTGSYTWSSTTSSVTTSAPQIPTMERVTKGEITTTTASITGNIAAENGASITAKGICYSSTNTLPAVGQGGTTCTSNGTGTGQFTASITGLTANTLYYFRSYATNSAGSGYSGADTFTTETTPPAGFPQVVSTTGLYDRVNSTTHNVVMPAVVDAGDLLVVLTANDGSATVTTPSGWTQLFTTANSTSLRLGAYYKFAAGTEDGTSVNFATSASEILTAQVYRITGALAVESGTAATGTSTAPNPPSLTPSWGARDTLWLSALGADNGSIVVSAYPTNYTNGRLDKDTYSSSTTYASAASARRYLNAISEDPGTFTLTGSNAWLANTIAVRPQPSTPVIASPPTQANVTYNSATLGGNITDQGASAVDVRGVCYSVTATNASPEHGGTGVTCANHASGGTGIFTVNVTSLEPETGYSYKAFAHNTQGYAYTSADTFTTLTNAPTGVTTNNESELGSYKVRFHGSANPNGSQAYGYFRFFTSVPDCTVDSGGTRIPSSSSFDYDLGDGNSPVAFDLPTPTTINLTRNTDYWYCAYARNVAAGPSSPGTSSGAGYDTFTTTDGPASGCDSPASGSLTVTEACSFLQSDYDGVDAGGSGSSNTGVLTLGSGGIVTILPGQRIARGGIVMAGGGMAIGNGNGGVIRGGLWLKDADGDGWVDSPIVKVVSSTQPAGFIRRNHAYTLPAYNSTDFNYASKFYNADSNNPDLLDCDGTNFYKYRNVPNLVRDADRDGYKTAAAPATVCVGASTVINGRTYYNDGSGEN